MLQSHVDARAIGAGQGVTPWDYLKVECGAVARYLRLALWPHPLVFDYGPEVGRQPPTLIDCAPAALLLATIMGAALWAGGRRWAGGFLGVTFFVLLAPTSSVVPVAGQPIAENRAYLPAAVVAVAAVLGAHRALGRRGAAAAACVVFGFALLSLQRNADYRSDEAIWQDTVAKRPGNARAWVYLSFAQNAGGRGSEAIATLATATRVHPQNAEIENNLAAFLHQSGRSTEAIPHFRRAIALKPDYTGALANFGTAALGADDLPDAIACFEALARLEPGNAATRNTLGVCFAKAGRTEEAKAQFQAALALQPDFTEARNNLEYLLKHVR
jgi:tetratricopeptide (TPR) repeat protein